MDDTHLAAALKLAATPGLNNQTRCRLLEQHHDPTALLASHSGLLPAGGGTKQQNLAALFEQVDDTRIARQIELLRQHDIGLVLYGSERYPAQLRQLHDAPPLLFVRGRGELLNGPQLAMVGSRRATPVGLRTAGAFAAEFSASGLTVTSGLAAGIDTAAHHGALEQLGGTVAVVATGLDEVYPRSNLDLADKIAEKGCLVSEFPPLTPPRRTHFPQRNRLISALSLGVLVVEADTRSGSLITARLAGEQGRGVFAIPGSIHSPTSRGCHQLIKQGAALVETTADVLVELRPGLESTLRQAPDNPPAKDHEENNLDENSARVLNLIDFAPTRLEYIAAHSNLPVELVSSALLQLELAGRISPLPGGQYQRISD